MEKMTKKHPTMVKTPRQPLPMTQSSDLVILYQLYHVHSICSQVAERLAVMHNDDDDNDRIQSSTSDLII